MLKLGEWYFKVRPSVARPGYFGWCAKTLEGFEESPMTIPPQYDVYCQHGDTEQQVISKLAQEVGLVQ